MNVYYILDKHKPKEVDMKTWAKGSNDDWRIAEDFIGDIHISTVFFRN